MTDPDTWVYDGYVGLLGTLDGAEAEVIVAGASHIPATDHQVVSDITDIAGRAPVTLTVTSVDGVVTVGWDTDPEVDIDGATRVAGWAVALDGVDDDNRPLVAWHGDFGGLPPDPYPISVPDGLAVAQRP